MEILGTSKNKKIIVNRSDSHINNDIKPLIKKALAKMLIDSKVFQEITVRFNRNIGYTNVVELKKSDKIFYAKRIGREGYSRFVSKAQPKKSPFFTIILLKSKTDANEYILITAYIGERAGPEPYDKNCLEKDKQYWMKLAFVPKLVDYDKRTVTTRPLHYWKD